MIHKTREGRPYDKGNVFILGDVTHETLRSLEMLLERDGYGAAVVEKQDNGPRFTDPSSESVLLASDDADRRPIPQQVDNPSLVPKAEVPKFPMLAPSQERRYEGTMTISLGGVRSSLLFSNRLIRSQLPQQRYLFAVRPGPVKN